MVALSGFVQKKYFFVLLCSNVNISGRSLVASRSTNEQQTTVGSWHVELFLPTHVCSEMTLCGRQDVNIQVLTNHACPPFARRQWCGLLRILKDRNTVKRYLHITIQTNYMIQTYSGFPTRDWLFKYHLTHFYFLNPIYRDGPPSLQRKHSAGIYVYMCLYGWMDVCHNVCNV